MRGATWIGASQRHIASQRQIGARKTVSRWARTGSHSERLQPNPLRPGRARPDCSRPWRFFMLKVKRLIAGSCVAAMASVGVGIAAAPAHAAPVVTGGLVNVTIVDVL